jgi:hypothetical protein
MTRWSTYRNSAGKRFGERNEQTPAIATASVTVGWSHDDVLFLTLRGVAVPWRNAGWRHRVWPRRCSAAAAPLDFPAHRALFPRRPGRSLPERADGTPRPGGRGDTRGQGRPLA